MPYFNVGDEFEFIGERALQIAQRFSPNGRTYTVVKVEGHMVWHTRCTGDTGWFHNDDRLRLVRPAGPPTTTREMSRKLMREMGYA